MITRRKRPINPSKQSRTQSLTKPQFKPKDCLPPLDLLTDFQFTSKKDIKLSDIKIRTLLKDLYPYYRFSSLTTSILLFVTVQFLWQEFYSENQKNFKYIDSQNSDIASFWMKICAYFVYTNFLLIFGSYMQTTYKFWYFLALGVTYFIGIVIFAMKNGYKRYQNSGHIFTATYSIFWLVLVEKRMRSINLVEMWLKFKQLPIWQSIGKLITKQQQIKQNNMIDFAFTERPLSIKGGQTDDSFSYDSFFSYPQSYQSSDDRPAHYKGYFQSNISKRSSYISNNLQPKLAQLNQVPYYVPKFSSEKSLLQQGQIESTIESSQTIKRQKQQEEIQLMKIYKCLILSFFVYANVTKIEWISYLVGGCTLLGCVQILVNEKLKFLKFSCFFTVAFCIILWM